MGLYLREVDVERLDRALTTVLTPLVFESCDDWRLAVESAVAELLDGDHVVFGIPHDGLPMHVHSINVPQQAQRAIQTMFGGLPDLPTDRWLQEAELERQREGLEVWSRLRAFWRAAAGQPLARRRSPFIGEVVGPGRMYDSENIDWSFDGGHVALCVSYSNTQSTTRRRRGSPRHAAGALLNFLLPAVKTGVTLRLAHDRQLALDATLARFRLTPREVDVIRLLARRASNKEIAEQLSMSPHTVRHHVEKIFEKLGIHSRRSIAGVVDHEPRLT